MGKNIIIDGVEYVPKGSEASVPAKSLKGKKYVIVRAYSAGVFAGYLERKEEQNVILLQARRLWYWKGSASLSELAVHGVSAPRECKFPCEVSQVELDQVIEVLEVTKKAQDSIASVPVWSAQ